MWFKRKAKNRRFKRERVLEVKLRSDKLRVARLRLISVLLSVCFGTAFGLLVAWRGGEWLLDRLVLENDAFAIRKIEIHNDGVIAPEQLRRWAAVKEGDNLLTLDLARIKQDLELVPLIQSAAVDRVLPRTLRLRVTERVPIAQVYALRPRPAGAGYEPVVFHLDEAGYVMPPLDPRLRADPSPPPTEGLPALLGVNGADLRPGHALVTPQIRAALRLIAAFDNSAMVGLVDLKHIDVSGLEVLRVSTGQGNEITFGLEQIELQLRRWRAVHDTGLRQQLSIASLDLSVTNNIPARWTEAVATPPPAAKPASPLRPRKKNV